MKITDQFKLGHLPTEAPHPLTTNLSELSKNNPEKACSILKEVDQNALGILKDKTRGIINLKQSIDETISSGKKIYLAGCGSTGRLSIALEVLWRTLKPDDSERVVGFMAGGDSALIKAIEDFEDHPEFAAKHLEYLGFKDGDLLIASSEGGETPFVIGAVEYAKKISSRSPFFLYCNPNDVLVKNIERSKHIIEDHGIFKINLSSGPMALSGSTRMQASTLIEYVIGLALFGPSNEISLKKRILEFIAFIENLDFSFLVPFIMEESNLYLKGGFIVYETDEYGITILTDTTERAPTFNLAPFENLLDTNPTPSLCYMGQKSTDETANAWNKILLRSPRTLDWPNYPQTSAYYFQGFDVSGNAINWRTRILDGLKVSLFSITREADCIVFDFAKNIHQIPIKDLPLLEEHLLLKLLLNIHSTLIMGRMDRYYKNIMTWVKPSCNKLVDRAIRYILILLEEEGIKGLDYNDVCIELFKQMDKISQSEPVVLKTMTALKKSYSGEAP